MIVRRAVLATTGAVLAVAAPVALATTSATAAPSTHAAAHARAATIVPTGGVTMLRLDPGTAKVLAANKITVAPASEARVVPSGIAFPIRGGAINANTARGLITHDGGLTFTAGGKSLTVRDFDVNTVNNRLTGYVDEARARINVLDLYLSHAHVAATSTSLQVSGIGARLDPAAAAALNKYFGTHLFKGGLTIGSARVSASIHVYK